MEEPPSNSRPEPEPDALGSSPNDSNYQAPEPKSSILSYFKTPVAIIKIVSVVFGFTALTLTAYGYGTATLFKETNKRRLCDWPKYAKINDSTNDCKIEEYYRDEICESYNDLFTRSKMTEYVKKACPSRWLVMPQTYFIGYVWVGTFIVLLEQLFLPLSKNRTFQKIDLIGHLVAACLMVVSGSCLIAYFVAVQDENMCAENYLKFEIITAWNSKDLRRRSGSVVVEDPSSFPDFRVSTPNNSSNSSESGGPSWVFDTDAALRQLLPKCPKIRDKIYLEWIFLSAGIFCLITGVLYIVIGVLSKLKSSQSRTSPQEEQEPGSRSMPQRSQASSKSPSQVPVSS